MPKLESDKYVRIQVCNNRYDPPLVFTRTRLPAPTGVSRGMSKYSPHIPIHHAALSDVTYGNNIAGSAFVRDNYGIKPELQSSATPPTTQ